MEGRDIFKALNTCCQAAFQKRVPVTPPPAALEKSLLILPMQQHLGLKEGHSSIQSLSAVLTMDPLSHPHLLFPHCPASLAPGLEQRLSARPLFSPVQPWCPAGSVELKRKRCACPRMGWGHHPSSLRETPRGSEEVGV